MSMPDEPRVTASPMYAIGQLQRAFTSLAARQSASDRSRAEAKIARWSSVLAGMADGTLTVGSRVPVAGTPAWVTPEVAHGGFASGRFLAEAPPRDDELAIASGLAREPGDKTGSTDRERVNLWFLSDPGLERLRRALSDGSYRVEVPEDAALPVVAWLLDHGSYEPALDLVAELRPWLHRLRFTPRLGVAPRPSGATVHLRTAGETAEDLRSRPTPLQIAVMRETIGVWHPLYDRLAGLWCDTVDGELPRLAGAAVEGGWPCRRWPADWAARRRAWLADYDEAAGQHQLAWRHTSRKSNFARLRHALERCETDSSSLTGRDVGRIRRALANTVTAHGAPDSAHRDGLRAQQAQTLRLPLHTDIARVLAGRLDQFPADSGIPSVDYVGADVVPGESETVPGGQRVPRYLTSKASRALEAPVADLVDQGIIGSAEVLAEILPQITAQVLAADFDDAQLRALHEQAYAAFRRRRGLLLLNLEHQVRFEELPWVAALEPLRGNGSDTRHAARRTLEQVTVLALSGFPQTILPNPLVAEMTALSDRAGLSLPLVEEVAADIFTGTFTDKWRRAALAASRSLAGTLYGRYYDLPAPETWAQPARSPLGRRWGKQTAEGFAALCRERSASEPVDAGGQGSFVAQNGTILEQSQILTTQNLAVLVDSLDLREPMTALAPELSARALVWVVRTLGQRQSSWRAGLQAVKNSAYAWRQAIYYLSLCDEPVQASALAELRGRLGAAGGDLELRFAPAVDGLAHVIAGGRFDASGLVPGGSGRRFLGWTAGRHWFFRD